MSTLLFVAERGGDRFEITDEQPGVTLSHIPIAGDRQKFPQDDESQAFETAKDYWGILREDWREAEQ
jgi:hypothetical protein